MRNSAGVSKFCPHIQEKFEALSQSPQGSLGPEEGSHRAGEAWVYQEQVEGESPQVAAKLWAVAIQQGCSDTLSLSKEETEAAQRQFNSESGQRIKRGNSCTWTTVG